MTKNSLFSVCVVYLIMEIEMVPEQCPVCKGNREIVLFTTKEVCDFCHGTGLIFKTVTEDIISEGKPPETWFN